MKKFIIVVTCLAVMPFLKGCGGGTGPEPPKEKIEEMQKAANEARDRLKKEYKQ